MVAPSPCRSFVFRPRRGGRAVLVVLGLLPAPPMVRLLAPAASAAEAPPVLLHHPHHHPHHVRTGHHPVRPKAAPQKPVVPVPAPPPKPPPVPANIGTRTGLPLPRFASLRADDVNMRSGPGPQYPILWLYKRRDLPVEIEREFDLWRLVRDADGVKGWVHQATLAGTRTFVVTAAGDAGAAAPELGGDHGVGTLLRDDPRDDGGIVAILRPGVIGRIRVCPAGSDWCRVSTHSYSGWLLRSAIFGLLPDEAIARP